MSDFTPTPERQKQILSLLTRQGRLSVNEIVEQFSISVATARRDLESLATQGKAERVHGGVIAIEQAPPELPILERESEQADEKTRIGLSAANLVADKETVFLGSGTTATQVLSYVDPDVHARIITHNLGAVSSAQEKALDVILLGGLYRPRSNSLEGALSLEVLNGFHASKFILGADGVSLEEGITTASVGLAGVERAMIRQTRGEVIVLADSSKIGVVGDFVICTLDDVQAVVVDDGLAEDVRDEMLRRGLRVVAV